MLIRYPSLLIALSLPSQPNKYCTRPHLIDMHSCCEDWTERQSIGSLIKETCFDSSRPNTIDPASYTKDIVLAARNFHPRFASIDDSCWCIAFRRAASELTLERDLGFVEDLYRVCRVAPTNQPNTVPLTSTAVHPSHRVPATKSNKKHPVNVVSYFTG